MICIDVVCKKVKLEIKNQEGEFIGTLLQTLGTLLFGNMLTGKGVTKAGRQDIKISI